MPFILLAILVGLIYLLYGKKLVHLVGKKVFSIVMIILGVYLLIKSGILGIFARMFSFFILKIEEFIGSL